MKITVLDMHAILTYVKKKVYEYNTCSAVMHYPECLQRFEKYDRKNILWEEKLPGKKSWDESHSFF